MSTTIEESPLHFKEPGPMQIALFLQEEQKRLKLTQQELALYFKKKRSTIANYLRLLKLPKKIQESLAKTEISMGHAKILISLHEEEQLSLWKKIVEQNLTVRQAEQHTGPLQTSSHFVMAEHLERVLERRFGTKVTLKEKREGVGRICIDFYSYDDLDRILEEFGVKSGD